MDFSPSPRTETFRAKLLTFMDECVYPNESTYEQQLVDAGDPHAQPAVMEELKREARTRGLWNLFHPHPQWGPGLTNVEYAPLAEDARPFTDRGPEACNCSAPDTGNMEVLTMFGTPEQQDIWLRPLLEGEIRSGYAMTEPDVASSDATNVAMRIERDADSYVLNGRKWWISGVAHPNCKILIVMGKTDPAAPPHLSAITDPRAAGLAGLDRDPHAADVRLPGPRGSRRAGCSTTCVYRLRTSSPTRAKALPSRRLARALDGSITACARSVRRNARWTCCARGPCHARRSATALAERANIMDWIAESRIEIEMTRLLTLKTAWLMDTVGNRAAAVEISAIKVAGPNMALRVMDRAIQVHGAMGMCDDTPLARMWVWQRALRFADGPDEVHKMTIARRELRRHDPDFRAT